jgi:hypothetical protein
VGCFRDRPFDTWTLDEITPEADAEAFDLMPGSGRRTYGPWRKLHVAMEAAQITVAGELAPLVRDRHHYSLRDERRAG